MKSEKWDKTERMRAGFDAYRSEFPSSFWPDTRPTGSEKMMAESFASEMARLRKRLAHDTERYLGLELWKARYEARYPTAGWPVVVLQQERRPENPKWLDITTFNDAHPKYLLILSEFQKLGKKKWGT